MIGALQGSNHALHNHVAKGELHWQQRGNDSRVWALCICNRWMREVKGVQYAWYECKIMILRNIFGK